MECYEIQWGEEEEDRNVKSLAREETGIGGMGGFEEEELQMTLTFLKKDTVSSMVREEGGREGGGEDNVEKGLCLAQRRHVSAQTVKTNRTE